jgi:hypothetical protein
MVQAPAPNVPLLWAVLQHIDEQPLSWTQSSWAARGLFGDMHCFAGHAVRISGHRFAWSDETETSCALDDRGLRVCVGSLARDLLGLTGDEAVDLFYAEDRAEIDRVVAAVEHRGAQLLLRESEDIDTRPCSSGRTMPDSLAYPIVAP